MFNLFNVYDCPNCGERLSDQVEYISVQLSDDEWGPVPFCDKCHHDVTMRVCYDVQTRQEMQVFQEVDDERAFWFHSRSKYDEDDNEPEDYDRDW